MIYLSYMQRAKWLSNSLLQLEWEHSPVALKETLPYLSITKFIKAFIVLQIIMLTRNVRYWSDLHQFQLGFLVMTNGDLLWLSMKLNQAKNYFFKFWCFTRFSGCNRMAVHLIITYNLNKLFHGMDVIYSLMAADSSLLPNEVCWLSRITFVWR